MKVITFDLTFFDEPDHINVRILSDCLPLECKSAFLEVVHNLIKLFANALTQKAFQIILSIGLTS